MTITYFQPDIKKTSGAYVGITGCIEKIDDNNRQSVMRDGAVISIDELVQIRVKRLKDRSDFSIPAKFLGVV